MKVLLAAQALPGLNATQVQLALITGWHSADPNATCLLWNIDWQTDFWECLESSFALGMNDLQTGSQPVNSDLNIIDIQSISQLNLRITDQVVVRGVTSTGENKWFQYVQAEFSLSKLYKDSENCLTVTVFWGLLSNIEIFAQMQQLLDKYGWQLITNWAKKIQLVCLIDQAFVGVNGILGHTRFGQTIIDESIEIDIQQEEKYRCACLADFVHKAKRAGVYQFQPDISSSNLSFGINLLSSDSPFDSTSCGKQKGSGAGGGLAAILSAIGAKQILVSDYLYSITNLESGNIASCDLVCVVVDELLLPMDPIFENLGTRCLELGVPVVVMAHNLLAGKHELPQLGVVETWPVAPLSIRHTLVSQVAVEQNHIISRAKRIAHMWSQQI